MARMTRARTVPSPTPASNTLTAALDRSVLRHERAHALHRFHGHASAYPQPAHELPVVYGAPPEGRLSHADAPAVIRHFAQQLLGRHVISSSSPPDRRLTPRRYYKMPRRRGSTTILPIVKVGTAGGQIPLTQRLASWSICERSL